MRKKTKKRSKSPEVTNLSMIEKLKAYFAQFPAFIAMEKMCDRISEKLLQLILALFALLSPCWSFFFIRKTPKRNHDNSWDTKHLTTSTSVRLVSSLSVSLNSIWTLPNPFSDQPVDNGPTNSARPEFESRTYITVVNR